MKRIVVPVVTTLVVVVSLIVVNGVNRSGEPRQRITLSEREVPLSWSGVGDKRGVRLRFEYQGRFDPLDARNWLTEERLRALGFVFDVMPSAPEAGDTYRRALPKIAWVAFEFDGERWRDIERRRALEPKSAIRFTMSSRLVPVDASLDRETLIARYPGGHLILRASIRLGYLDPQEKGPLVYGHISNLIPDHVSVPLMLKDRLASLPAGDEERTPRYEVDLALGRMGIPYVTDVRPLRVE
jgi:hypothetical protein